MTSLICSLGTVRMDSNWCTLLSAATRPSAATADWRASKPLTSCSRQGGPRGSTPRPCQIFTEASQTSSPTIMESKKQPRKQNQNRNHAFLVDEIVIAVICYLVGARPGRSHYPAHDLVLNVSITINCFYNHRLFLNT